MGTKPHTVYPAGGIRAIGSIFSPSSFPFQKKKKKKKNFFFFAVKSWEQRQGPSFFFFFAVGTGSSGADASIDRSGSL